MALPTLLQPFVPPFYPIHIATLFSMGKEKENFRKTWPERIGLQGNQYVVPEVLRKKRALQLLYAGERELVIFRHLITIPVPKAGDCGIYRKGRKLGRDRVK